MIKLHTNFVLRFRLSPKRRDDICMGSETSRKLTNAARSCARSSRFGSSSCNNAKATMCIYRRMGWISSRNFRKTNVKKIGADMFNVPAFKRVAGGSNKQGRGNQPRSHLGSVFSMIVDVFNVITT